MFWCLGKKKQHVQVVLMEVLNSIWKMQHHHQKLFLCLRIHCNPHPPHLSPTLQGDHFWRFDRNMVVEPGFPKPLASEFPGLTGTISAALAVPATRKRPETVYFFKGGED